MMKFLFVWDFFFPEIKLSLIMLHFIKMNPGKIVMEKKKKSQEKKKQDNVITVSASFINRHFFFKSLTLNTA